jgi:hypothetical protein
VSPGDVEYLERFGLHDCSRRFRFAELRDDGLRLPDIGGRDRRQIQFDDLPAGSDR